MLVSLKHNTSLPLISNHFKPHRTEALIRKHQEGTVNKAGEMLGEGEGGEYTGQWKMMRVGTKEDPPSSATRGRMDAWGQPVTFSRSSEEKPCW
jgi:hypothetical protein